MCFYNQQLFIFAFVVLYDYDSGTSTNIMIVQSAILIHILEVPGSNFSSEPYILRFFVMFLRPYSKIQDGT
jgi:hypothetical protein